MLKKTGSTEWNSTATFTIPRRESDKFRPDDWTLIIDGSIVKHNMTDPLDQSTETASGVNPLFTISFLNEYGSSHGGKTITVARTGVTIWTENQTMLFSQPVIMESNFFFKLHFMKDTKTLTVAMSQGVTLSQSFEVDLDTEPFLRVDGEFFDLNYIGMLGKGTYCFSLRNKTMGKLGVILLPQVKKGFTQCPWGKISPGSVPRVWCSNMNLS